MGFPVCFLLSQRSLPEYRSGALLPCSGARMGFMQGFGKKKEGARIVHCYGGPGEGGKGARKKKKKKEASNVETSFDHRLVVVVAVVSGGQKEKKKKGDAFPGPSRRGSHD